MINKLLIHLLLRIIPFPLFLTSVISMDKEESDRKKDSPLAHKVLIRPYKAQKQNPDLSHLAPSQDLVDAMKAQKGISVYYDEERGLYYTKDSDKPTQETSLLHDEEDDIDEKDGVVNQNQRDVEGSSKMPQPKLTRNQKKKARRKKQEAESFLSEAYLRDVQEQLNGCSKHVVIYKEEAIDIRFPEDGSLSWDTDCILEIQTAGDIVFPAGFNIIYKGKGGGLILKPYSPLFWKELPGGKVEFEGKDNSQIDFSGSTNGAISIFYNPIVNRAKGWHKYHNPIDYSRNIKQNDDGVYLGSFMLINDESDLRHITENPRENYAFSKEVGIDTGYNYRDNEPISNQVQGQFDGVLNFNGFRFTSSRNFYWPNTHIEEIVFQDTLLKDHNIWGSHLIFMAPPLHGDYKEFLNLITQGDEDAAVALIPKLCPTSDYGSGRRLAYINGMNHQTPLHLAARYGHTKIVEAICERIIRDFKNSGFSFINRRDAKGNFALSLAAQYGHEETLNYLISLYLKYREAYPQQLIEQAITYQQKRNSEAYQNILHLLQQQGKKPILLYPHWQGFFNKAQARKKEYERAKKVHDRFFLRPLGTRRTLGLYQQFCNEYEKQRPSTLKLDGLPSRSRILLFKAVTDYKLTKLSFSGSPYSIDQLPTTYGFGGLLHTFINQPTREKPGYTLYKEMEKKEDIIKIAEICKHLDSRKVAELLRQSHALGQPITPQKLSRMGHLHEELLREDAEYLNRLNFLLDLEVASRLVQASGSAAAYDILPIGIAWARTQSLIIEKKNSYSGLECFIKTLKLHLFIEGAEEERETAIKTVSDQFNAALKKQRSQDKIIKQWEEEHPYSTVIATQEKLHQELLEEYGGGYESEGNDYESSDEESSLVSMVSSLNVAESSMMESSGIHCGEIKMYNHDI